MFNSIEVENVGFEIRVVFNSVFAAKSCITLSNYLISISLFPSLCISVNKSDILLFSWVLEAEIGCILHLTACHRLVGSIVLFLGMHKSMVHLINDSLFKSMKYGNKILDRVAM